MYSKKNLNNLVSDVSLSCNNWLNEWEAEAPLSVSYRRKVMHGFKSIVQTLIGIFIKPCIGQRPDVYIFQGLRNKEYMSVFSPQSVVIIGSHAEKLYAKAHGYSFSWAFPMQSAIYSNMSRGWCYPAIRQFSLWVEKLSSLNRVTFFLQEDTQPVGLFFVHLSKLFHSKASTVCIQHGYFVEGTKARLDGTLSDINFVYDQRQAELIGSNKERTFEIGLPYVAKAKKSKELNIILVGTGMANNCTDIYEKTHNVYADINRIFQNIAGVKVLYRPHPNEYNDEKIIAELTAVFSLVKSKDKLKQLNGPRAIFVGTLSTLLYEAGVAGHFIAHYKLHSVIKPVFDYDFEFRENELNDLLEWVISIKNRNETDHKSHSHHYSNPLERFKLALREANLVD